MRGAVPSGRKTLTIARSRFVTILVFKTVVLRPRGNLLSGGTGLAESVDERGIRAFAGVGSVSSGTRIGKTMVYTSSCTVCCAATYPDSRTARSQCAESSTNAALSH